MQLYLFNSYSNSKELFKPISPNKIGFYACGPTVYARPHLGNARSAVVFDSLFRLLKALYSEVIYVRNITDVDDKIIDAAKKNNEDPTNLTIRIEKYYQEDIASLNCLSPTFEPKATEHIAEMIQMIEALINNGNAYVADGHVLFSVKSFMDYGKLSNRNLEEMLAGARVEIADYKSNPMDFILWKPERVENMGFDSPWGYGRPGWHIECSAMAKKYLGKKFDIHGGGIDLIFPHHENEIAQSCCANNNEIMANYWVHNGFLTIAGEKMSKSLGNISTIRDMIEKGYDTRALRYFFLSAHYRKPLDLNDKALQDSMRAVNKFFEIADKYKNNNSSPLNTNNPVIKALCDDLNTPAAMSELHNMATKINKGDEAAVNDFLFSLDLLGINFQSQQTIQEIPISVISLAESRIKARQNKDWQKSDEIREKITSLGYEIKDTSDGYKLSRLVDAHKHLSKT